jgi:quercetin dioxygenase-like cupin family protein
MSDPRSAGVVAPAPTRSWWCLGTRSTVHIGREQTAGLFTLVELAAAPGVSTPRHVHRLEDEALLLRDGALRVECGDDVVEAGPGTTVFLPQRVPHSFTVVSDGPVLAWQVLAPAGYEDLLAALGEPANAPALPPAREVDERRVTDVAARHGVDVLGWPGPRRPTVTTRTIGDKEESW